MASKHVVVLSSDSDDDVWSHKPLKRIKATQETSSQRTTDVSSLTQVSQTSRSAPAIRGNPRLSDACARGRREDRDGDGAAAGGCCTQSQSASVTETESCRNQSQRRRHKSGGSKHGKYSSHLSNSKSHSTKSKTKSKTPVKTMKTGHEHKHEIDDEHQLKKEGFCPICQAPFRAIYLTSPEGHIQECLEFIRPEIG